MTALFIPTTQIGRIIVIIIFVFLAYGMLTVLWHLLRLLFFERRNLKQARRNFEEPMEAETEDLEKVKNHLLRGVGSKSAIYNRIEQIYQIKQMGGDLNHDALSDILVGKQSIMAGFSKHIQGILIILGLVGTLCGLLIALTEVEPFLRPEQITKVEQIARAIGNTLQGMKTAFSTTLAGLTATLILGATIFLFNQRQAIFLTDFEEFTANFLIPRFNPTGTNAIVQASTSLEVSSNALDRAVRKLTDVSWDARLDQSFILADSFKQSTSELIERLDKLRDLQYNVEQTLEAFAKQSKITNDNYVKLDKTIQEMLPDFQSESQKLLQLLDGYRGAQKTFVEQLINTMNENSKVLTQNFAAIFGEARSKFDQVSLSQQEVIKLLQQFERNVNLKEEFATLNAQLTQIVLELRSLPGLYRSLAPRQGTRPSVSQRPTRSSWIKRAWWKLSGTKK